MLRILTFIVITLNLCIAHSKGTSKKNPEPSFANRAQGVLSALTSTNNGLVFLKNKKLNLSSDVRKELIAIVKKSPSPLFQARQFSPTSFGLKLNNSKWLKFNYDLKKKKMFIGKTPFDFDPKIGVKNNVARIKAIILKETSSKKAFFNWGLISEAKAEELKMNTPEVMAAVAAAANAEYAASAHLQLILDMARICKGDKGNLHLIAPKNHEETKTAFYSYVKKLQRSPNTWDWVNIDNAWGRYWGMYRTFYRAQECLIRHKVITERWVRDSHQEGFEEIKANIDEFYDSDS